MTVTSRRILRSATLSSLVFVLIGTALFYFQLGYQFPRRRRSQFTQAVSWCCSSSLFCLPADPMKRHSQARVVPSSRRRLLWLFAGTVLLLRSPSSTCLLSAESRFAGSIEAGRLVMITMQDIGHAMLGTDRFQYLLPLEAVSVLFAILYNRRRCRCPQKII